MAYLNRELIRASDSPSIDAFGRWRTSVPFTVFDSKLVSDKGALFYDEEVNGTATSSHNTGDASVSMDVSANADYVVRQTFQRFNYQPGKSQEIILTGVLGAPVTDTVSRIGYFNSASTGDFSTSYDGIYIESNGTELCWCIGKSGVINSAAQSSWSIDTMDGSGPSGITLDFDKTQIFFIDFEWLGVGRVRCGFVVDGLIYYAHEFLHANNTTGVYMSSPNHSVRYEIRSTGGTKTMKQICSSVLSEGGVDPSGVTRGISMTSAQTVGTTFEGLIGFRLKSTNLCSSVSIANFTSVITSANDDVAIAVLRNPTYANTPTWNSAGTSSAVEFAIGGGANTVSDNGDSLGFYFASSAANIINNDPSVVINPGVAIDGTRDEFWLAARSTSGSADVAAAINISEQTCG